MLRIIKINMESNGFAAAREINDTNPGIFVVLTSEIHTTEGIIKINEPLQKIVNAEMVTEFAPWGNKTYLVKLAHTDQTALITLEKAKEFRKKYCIGIE